MMNHEFFMDIAINEAKKAFETGEVPIGAVIVNDGNIIGKGRNRKEEKNNPISHAEIEAISEACLYTGNWRLNGSVIYVTSEPCIMCAGAILHARIDRVIFGVNEPKFGGIVSCANIFDIHKFNHRAEWLSGICSEKISDMMKNFFIGLRK